MSDLVSQNLNMIFKTPKGETVHALKDVSFTLKKGELLTVLGPSGCGKTTLLAVTSGSSFFILSPKFTFSATVNH